MNACLSNNLHQLYMYMAQPHGSASGQPDPKGEKALLAAWRWQLKHSRAAADNLRARSASRRTYTRSNSSWFRVQATSLVQTS